MTSDCITNRYRSRSHIAPLVQQLPSDLRQFVEANEWPVSQCTIFPGRTVNRRPTINMARGITRSIGDRIDLTLECIRLHYAGGVSPLSDVLNRYSSFFDLFIDFEGYVDFFLLQDLVSPDYKAVRFFLPFAGFGPDPVPTGLDEYTAYLRSVCEFVNARRGRVLASIV